VRGLAPRDLLRAAARHRVLLASGLAAAAVASGLSAVVPAPAATVPVLTAAHDLAAGAALGPDDVVVAALPRALVPAGALSDVALAAGRLLAGPVRQGEPLTDVRLLGAGLLPPGPEVAVPVRLAEPATGALVQAGDVVDVLSAAPEGGPAAQVVATRLTVLAVPALADAAGEGALVVVAASRSTAARLAAAAVTGRLSVAVHPR
jgi:Flp pilus assembly protein CpaB